ncbi:MAG: hypothetical protein KDI74_08510 [Gammaproteobacteria bacterium]|nr:hypothetical protein [Gammaproteobacteria bacterium]
MANHQLARSLGGAILNQDDPETVRSGAPAYLLLIDGMIADRPDDATLLLAGARLYAAYANGLVDDPDRRKLLTTKSKDYAARALCGKIAGMCAAAQMPFEQFAAKLGTTTPFDLEAIYTLAVSWAVWIQAHSDDWNALADLGRVEYLLQRIIDLQPDYARGRAQLYLGIIRTQLPAAMGGDPERGRRHFERAVEFSNSRDLMAKVEFARSYARLVYDKVLHDRLLHEVIAADPREPDLTLSNTLAQRLAHSMLQDDYF